MKYRVTISIKDGVLDPEMETLQRLLKRSGVQGVAQLAHTQQFDITFTDDVAADQAGQMTKKIAEDVLANPEIHDWTVEPV